MGSAQKKPRKEQQDVSAKPEEQLDWSTGAWQQETALFLLVLAPFAAFPPHLNVHTSG
jgi:hypothetical protein